MLAVLVELLPTAADWGGTWHCILFPGTLGILSRNMDKGHWIFDRTFIQNNELRSGSKIINSYPEVPGNVSEYVQLNPGILKPPDLPVQTGA